MPESILNETKDAVNVEEDDTAFDLQIKLYINSAFSTLNQLGIGPDEGFRITGDSQVWTDFLEDGPMLDKVKEYISLKTRYSWDPPGTGYHTTAMKELIAEAETRLSYMREETEWVPPVPEDPTDVEDPFGDPIILDGG